MYERQVIKNYIRDNYHSIRPGYYVWNKTFYLEWIYMQWACDDILDEIYNHPNMRPQDVLEKYKNDMTEFLRIAKTDRSRFIFEKAVYIAKELEGLFL